MNERIDEDASGSNAGAPRPPGPPPLPVPTLSYGTAERQRPTPRTPVWLQAVAGFLAWAGWVGAICGLAMAIRPTPGSALPAGSVVTFFASAAGLFAVGVLLRVRFGWRGFLPGIALGLVMTCLVPVGILLYVCGHS